MIEIMGGVMKPLAGSPIFTDLMGKVTQIPVLGVLLGMVMTLVVQSSSATIAVLQNFASQAGADGIHSVIGLTGAIPILLGDNIGTTITALLASIGQSKNAKRTAVAAQQNYTNAHEIVKSLQEHISNYITRLFSGGGLTESQSEQTAGLLFVTNNMDRVADRCEEINAATQRFSEEGKKLSKEARDEVHRCFKIANNLFSASMEAVTLGDEQIAAKVTKEKKRMRKAQKNCNKAHLSRVKDKACDANMTAAYSDILYNLDRIADNCVGIAEEAMDHVTLVRLEDLEDTVREQMAEQIGALS